MFFEQFYKYNNLNYLWGENMSLLISLSMFPTDKGASVSSYVARSLKIIDDSGLEYRTNSMSTVIEGEYDEVMDVVRQCYEKMASDCNRVYFVINGDYRKNRENGLVGKIDSVKKKAGIELKT